MENNLTEVYAYYKKQYPLMLILFRDGNDYITSSTDQEIIRNILGVESIPEADIIPAMQTLGNVGHCIKIIEQVDKYKRYVLPDIPLVEQEIRDDY